jgi:hypothetical protein
MTAEYIEPTRESRRNLLLLVVVAIAVGGAIRFWLFPALFAHIGTLPKCGQIKWLRNCLIVVVASPPLYALWAVPHAMRMLKLNQSPLPGTWVFRRTPIARGRVVRLRAFGLLFLSAIAPAFPVFGMHQLQSTPFAFPNKICPQP